MILADSYGEQWQALDLSADWRGKRIDRKVSTYRYVSRNIHTLTCRATDAARVKKAFADDSLNFFARGPDDYRGYLAEYPKRWPYRRRVSDDPISFTVKSAGIDLDFVSIRQLRGSEWERDYSLVERSPSLLMPAIGLIEGGDLQWDGRGSWLDSQGLIQVMDPWWWSDRGPGLVVRLGYLDRILEKRGKALVIKGFQTKFVTGMSMVGLGRLTERTLFIRSKGQTKLFRRKFEND